jgi:single-stranded-DNA-specific exonuclease
VFPVWVLTIILPEGPTVRDVGAVLINPLPRTETKKECALCATGVLGRGFSETALAPEEWLRERLDLVALATVADCVSLVL